MQVVTSNIAVLGDGRAIRQFSQLQEFTSMPKKYTEESLNEALNYYRR